MKNKVLSLLLMLWCGMVAMNAQSLAPEGFYVIEEQPDGELRTYIRTGFTVKEHEEGGEEDYHRYVTKDGVQDGTMNIVFGADRSVYLQFIVSESYYDGWVQGTLNDDGTTITVPMGQYTAYARSFDMATQVWLMNYDADGDTFVVDHEATDLLFSVSDDGTITMLGTDENHVVGVVNRCFGTTFSYLDWEWHGIGDFQSVFTPTESHAVTPPETLETHTLIATAGYHDGVGWGAYERNVLVGFDGNDVWMQGLCSLLPKAWVRGTRNGDVITLPSLQELGSYYGTMLYLVSAVPDDNAEPVIGPGITFTYDARRNVWVSFDDIMINSSATEIQYLYYFMGMTLALEPDRVAEVPEGLNLVEYTMNYQEPNEQGRLVSKTYTMEGTERDGHVYLKGFTPYAPEAYVVGTISTDGQVVFQSPQYLGKFNDEESGFDYPIYFQAFDGSTGELLPEVTFDRDAATHVLSNPSTAISIGINKTGLLSQQYIYNAELTPLAVEQTVHIGYCDDSLADDIHPVGISSEGNSRISAAIHLPRTLLMHYQGMSITKLRFAVRQGFGNVSVWIRTQLDASSVVVQGVSEVVNGWNEVTLNEPLTIDGNDLYIGYTATQPQGFEGILAYGEGDEYTSWLAVDNQWADYHSMGLGRLYIQAVAEGLLRQRDVTVISLAADRQAYAPSDMLAVSGEVENLGSADVQGYTLTYYVDGIEVNTQTSNQLLRPDEVTAFMRELPLTGLSEGSHELAVAVDDEIYGSRQLPSLTFYVYENTYARTLLLEHFTSLPCVNCPRDDAKLEEVVPGRDDVAWVAHHVGYKDDEFTLEAERMLTRFGVDGNPYIMLDRTAFNEGEPPAFTIGNYDAATVNTIFDYAASMPAFVQLHAGATVEGDQLTMTVDGEARAFVTELYPRAALHVYIVEDGVTAEGVQAGDANKKQHDNIMRQMVTPVRGTQLVWTTTDSSLPEFSNQLSVTVDPSWNVQKLRVVAFVTAQAPTGSGWPTGEVLNTTQAHVTDAQGIMTQLSESETADATVYDLQGRRVNSSLHTSRPTMKKGLYICNGKKFVK